jgi:hypothetical protein
LTLQEFIETMEKAREDVVRLVRNMRETRTIDPFQEIVAEQLIDLLTYWSSDWDPDDEVLLEYWRLTSLERAYGTLNDSIIGGFGSLMGQTERRAESHANYMMYLGFDNLLLGRPIWGPGNLKLPRR